MKQLFLQNKLVFRHQLRSSCVCARMVHCFTRFLTPIGGSKKGRNNIRMTPTTTRKILCSVLNSIRSRQFASKKPFKNTLRRFSNKERERAFVFKIHFSRDLRSDLAATSAANGFKRNEKSVYLR